MMNALRRFYRHTVLGQITLYVITLLTSFYCLDEQTWAYNVGVLREQSEKLAQASKTLGVDERFVKDPLAFQGSKYQGSPSQGALSKEQEDASKNRTKALGQLQSLDVLFRHLAALLQADAATPVSQVEAEVAALRALLTQGRLPLPELLPDLPGQAQGRHNAYAGKLNALLNQLKNALKDKKPSQDVLVELHRILDKELQLRHPRKRWTQDPFPYQVVEGAWTVTDQPGGVWGDFGGGTSAITTAPAARMPESRKAGTLEGKNQAAGSKPPATSTAPHPLAPNPQTLTARPSSSTRNAQLAARSLPQEIVALAASLENRPSRVYHYVRDRVAYEPYWGVRKGALRTLQEGRGGPWDQALLLQALLQACGAEATLEWGKIRVKIGQLQNLLGVDTPAGVGRLLGTAGIPGTLLSSKGVVVGAELEHVWVKAHLKYLPFRGTEVGTGAVPDTWVRIDPALKEMTWSQGIAVAQAVPFGYEAYFTQAGLTAPRAWYEQQVWNYLRAQGIPCANLEEVKKQGALQAEPIPFIPGTLPATILETLGEAVEPPQAFVPTVTYRLKDENSQPLCEYTLPIADLAGRSLSLDFAGATASDEAIIQQYGGLLRTPAYLIDLKGRLILDGAVVAEGGSVTPGADLLLEAVFTKPGSTADTVRHDILAGEWNALLVDPGKVPDATIAELQAAVAAATDPAKQKRLKLELLLNQYFHHLDRDLESLSGLRHQRLYKEVFEGMASERLNVTYTAYGAPLALVPANLGLDVARLPIGLTPISGDSALLRPAVNLLGLQSSYLEGSLWGEVFKEIGVGAAQALTRSKEAGQGLYYQVTASTIETVLGQVNLGADEEAVIRQAVLSQGRVAYLPSAAIQVGHWTGTGYILEDPQTGAATYPIAGNYAGGSSTGDPVQDIQDLLGSEPWLEGSPLGDLLRQLLELLGGGSGSGGDGGGPGTYASDPVHLGTGNLYRTETDFSIVARGIPVSLTRYYNSRSSALSPQPSAFGNGWTHTYGETLTENAEDGSVAYQEADGTVHTFTLVAGNFVSPPGKYLTLVKDASGYTLTTKYQTKTHFLSNGAMDYLEDTHGNRVTLLYDADGKLWKVQDASARPVLTFSYNPDGTVQAITDLSDRTYQYGYTDGRLTSVTDPLTKTTHFGYDLAGRLTTVTDPLGNTDTFYHDAFGRCYQHVDKLGYVENFYYDTGEKKTVRVDRRGNEFYSEYDQAGRITMAVDPAGNHVFQTWNADNNKESLTNERGYSTQWTYYPNGNLHTETNPLSQTTSYEYDPLYNQVAKTINPDNTFTISTYDPTTGDLLTSTDAEGKTTTNHYDAYGQLESTTDPLSHTSHFGWNDHGAMETRTDALGNTTSMVVDDLGRIKEIHDPAGQVTKVEMDGKDRIRTITDPYNNQTTFEYDAAGRRTKTINALGETVYAYDASGRVLRTTNPAGAVTRTEYDPEGNVLARFDAKGNKTSYEYDAIGRMTSMIDALGNPWGYGYCGEIGGGGGCSTCGGGGYCEITDPYGNKISQTFDELGRATEVKDALGNTAKTEFDNLGRKISSTDALNRTTYYRYWPSGRLKEVEEANGAKTGFTYDDAGNKKTMTNPLGKVWQYGYDANNQLVTETDPLGNITEYAYTSTGQLWIKRLPNGWITKNVYTGRRLMEVRSLYGLTMEDAKLPVNVGALESSFGYDTLGRRTSAQNSEVSLTYVYDTLNRIHQVTNQTLGQTIIYGYDQNGNTTSMLGPKGETKYIFDAKNRLSRQTDPVAGTFEWTYNALDRRMTLKYPNNLTTYYDYDNAYRLKSLITKNTQGDIIDGYSYLMDAVGNRTSMTSLRDNQVTSYEYDDTYRLTKATYPWANYEIFDYFPDGNRKSLTDKDGITNYTYDDANRLLNEVRGTTTTNYTWDNAGNMLTKADLSGTTTYEWNYDSRLIRSTVYGLPATTYGYDPSGIRVRLTEGTTTKRFLYSNEDIIAEYGGASEMYYVHGPLVDEPLAQLAGTTLSYMHRDGLGSVTAFSNAGGQLAGSNAYTSFGNVHETSGVSSRYGYTSRELDDSGLMYYRSRYYQPEIGRFLNQDFYQGDQLEPPSLHRYTYTHNNPIMHVDPTGKTMRDIAHVNNWLQKQYPQYAIEYEMIAFLPVPAAMTIMDLDFYGFALLSISQGDFHTSFTVLSIDFLGEIDSYMRYKLVETIVHEKLHMICSWLYAEYLKKKSFGLVSNFVGLNWIIAIGDAFTKRNPFNKAEFSKLHILIENISEDVAEDYCSYASANGLPCGPGSPQ